MTMTQTPTIKSPYSICENPKTLCRSKGLSPRCECGFPRHGLYTVKGSELNALRELRKKLDVEKRQKERAKREAARKLHDSAGR